MTDQHRDQRPPQRDAGGGGRPPRNHRKQQLPPDIPPHRLNERTYTSERASDLGGYCTLHVSLVQVLPLPIAHRTELVAAQRNPEGQIDSLIDAFRCATRFLALVALAQYLRAPSPDSGIAAKLSSFLSQPRRSEGTWVNITREALRPYATSALGSLVPELASFYFLTGGGTLTPEARAFEEWVEFRNRLAHPEGKGSSGSGSGGSPGPTAAAERHAAEWLKALALFIQDMAFFTAYELLQPLTVSLHPAQITAARIFRGPALAARYVHSLELPITADRLEPEESLLLIRGKRPEWQLLLSPFLFVGDGGTLLALQSVTERNGRVVGATYVEAATLLAPRPIQQERQGAKHLVELIRLLKPLGPVGVPADTEERALQAHRPGDDPWRALSRWASDWVQSGYSYDIVLKFDRENDLKVVLENPEGHPPRASEELRALVLVLSLHYRLSWLSWVEQNRTNVLAVTQLVRVLRVANRHHRPRLRALYAMQLVDRAVLNSVLAEAEWPAADLTLIRRYVLTGRVKEYLRFLAEKGQYPLPQKADQVLTEIEPTGAGGIDLPLGPDDDEPETPGGTQ